MLPHRVNEKERLGIAKPDFSTFLVQSVVVIRKHALGLTGYSPWGHKVLDTTE